MNRFVASIVTSMFVWSSNARSGVIDITVIGTVKSKVWVWFVEFVKFSKSMPFRLMEIGYGIDVFETGGVVHWIFVLLKYLTAVADRLPNLHIRVGVFKKPLPVKLMA